VAEKEKTANPGGTTGKSKRGLPEPLQAKERFEDPWDQLIAVFDAIDEKVYVADPETYEIIYANPAKMAIFGDDIVGGKCYTVFQGLDKPCDFCTNPIILGENFGKTHIWRFKNRKTGKWMRCIDRAIRWRDGRIVRFELAVDIHDLKSAEEAARESEQKYRQLVENIHEAIYTTDRKGIVTYVSPAIEAMTGFSPSEILGRHFSEFILSNDAEYLVSRYPKALLGQGRPAEYRLLTKSGDHRWVRTITRRIHRDGEVIGLQGALADITDLKKTEEALKEREKELTKGTADLEEANAALRILLDKRERDKAELEEKVLLNVRQLVSPFIDRLRKVTDGRKRKGYVNAVEANLQSITSSFSRDLQFRYETLTPTEVRIAALIKEGNSTREIAELMDLSYRTVESHRKNLRRKMGLKDKKMNLRTMLLSIK